MQLEQKQMVPFTNTFAPLCLCIESRRKERGNYSRAKLASVLRASSTV